MTHEQMGMRGNRVHPGADEVYIFSQQPDQAERQNLPLSYFVHSAPKIYFFKLYVFSNVQLVYQKEYNKLPLTYPLFCWGPHI
jgi:hypothetical protein